MKVNRAKKNNDGTGEYVYSLPRPKRSRNKRSSVVYSLPERFRHDMFVEAITLIISQGPKPMKKRQPIKFTGEYVYSWPRSKRSRKKRTGVVYSLSKRFRHAIFLEAIKLMMSESPQPMRKRDPVEKLPNSAEQLWQANQAEYEVQVKSDNVIDQVERHNAAYPQLDIELDERWSTSKPLEIWETLNKLNEKV